jgi:hypothetical protein
MMPERKKRGASMTKRIAIPIIFAALAVVGGCRSQLPLATTYPATTQQKMQAAHHWDVLAADVAERVEAVLDDREDLENVPLDVKTDGQGAFYDVFEDLVTSHLVSRGIPVPAEREGAMALFCRVRIVRHSSRMQRPTPGLLTAIGTGVAVARDVTADWIVGAAGAGLLADVGAGYLVHASDIEVVITNSIVHRNRYVMHTSDIYYVNEPDSHHYGDKVAGEEQTPPPLPEPETATMGVVNE